METKDYVKIFRLDQENFQFNRGEFMNKMGRRFTRSMPKATKDKPSNWSHILFRF